MLQLIRDINLICSKEIRDHVRNFQRKQFFNLFSLYIACIQESPPKNYIRELGFDGANGVGAIEMKQIAESIDPHVKSNRSLYDKKKRKPTVSNNPKKT